MLNDSPGPYFDGRLLGAVAKLVRKARSMSVRETAAAMNMSLRTLQRFEAGAGQVRVEDIFRFAAATSIDPHALIASVAIGSTRYARNTMNNKLTTVVLVGAQKLEKRLGDRIAELDTRTLVNAVSALVDDLTDHILSPDPTKTWLENGRRDLSAKPSKSDR